MTLLNEQPGWVTVLAGGAAAPRWDPATQTVIVKETDEWIVSVAPMIFNDRVLLTHKDEYPVYWTAGWCYDKGGAAILAAIAWDPDTDRQPVGFKKEAADLRPL